MLFIAGLALAALLLWRFVAALEPAQRFLAPGNAQVELAHPGEYVIWHEHRTVHQGRSYDVPAGLPDGTRFAVQAPDASAVPVQAYSGMSSEGSEGRSVSVARFEVPAAGVYRVAVEGRFDARPMSVGPNRLGRC